LLVCILLKKNNHPKKVQIVEGFSSNLHFSSENNLRQANNKADDLTVKKLVRKSPTMKTKFDEI